jgi:hypothetical protein
MNREEAINLFLARNHADFTRKQADKMADQAEASNGQSADYGDGYGLAKTIHGWAIQISGLWIFS